MKVTYQKFIFIYMSLKHVNSTSNILVIILITLYPVRCTGSWRPAFIETSQVSMRCSLMLCQHCNTLFHLRRYQNNKWDRVCTSLKEQTLFWSRKPWQFEKGAALLLDLLEIWFFSVVDLNWNCFRPACTMFCVWAEHCRKLCASAHA